MAGKRLGWLVLGVLPLMIGVTTTSSAGPTVGQVSNDSRDDGKGDGTHDTQLNPSSSFWSGQIGFTGFDRFSGGSQVVGTSYTVDGGRPGSTTAISTGAPTSCKAGSPPAGTTKTTNM
jgi:hypothetical protein